jgi:phosphatidylserine/phosphatidylglycerophosphate/cardiolipin synthase-like enzyme
MNLSSNALDNNREIGIIVDDPDVVKQFVGQFERDWEKREDL